MSRHPEESGLDYDTFCFLAELPTAERLSKASGNRVTWLDLVIDYALSIEAARRGESPEALRITAKETAAAMCRYCGESVEKHLPPTKEIAAALRERKYLRQFYPLIS